MALSHIPTVKMLYPAFQGAIVVPRVASESYGAVVAAGSTSRTTSTASA
jgi:hypothetical protein